MRWARSATESKGFSVVEALLAATLFGLLTTAIGGALIFTRTSANITGDRARAIALADEGIEAVRNIRDSGYANLTDGTFGITQSSNQWVLSGSSDTSGMYTRQVSIASNGTTRKTVTSRVSWQQTASTRQVSLTSQLTNWMASILKTWPNGDQKSGYDTSSSGDGIKVATQGNFAYLIVDGSPDLYIFNISNPASPALVGSLSVTGTPTNIAVNGNYIYLSNTSDSAELQVIEVSNPAAPVLRGSYNAAGTADGTGVYVIDTVAYLTRKANSSNNEFVIINVATPTAPTRINGYNINVNLNEVYVNASDGAIYIATDSDTQEIVKLTYLLGIIGFGATINLPGTANATTIDGFGSTLLVGQGNTLYSVDGGLIFNTIGSVALSNSINDVAVNTARNYAFVGTTGTTAEFQIVNISNLSSPSLVKSVDIPGTASNLTGVAYNSSLDVVPGASTSDTQELVIFGPN